MIIVVHEDAKLFFIALSLYDKYVKYDRKLMILVFANGFSRVDNCNNN
jgi:hypothetical protein